MPQTDEHFTPREIAPLRAKPSELGLSPKEQVDSVRKDLGYFAKNYRQFRANYPELDHELEVKFPGFQKDTDELMYSFELLSAPNAGLTDEEAVQFLETYNGRAHRVNDALDSLKKDQAAAQDPLHAALSAGEDMVLSESQKKETAAFARSLYQQIFPESYTSQVVRWSTGQSHLEDYQKVLVAPAEGIEAVASGFVSLFNPQTYKDLNDGIQTACGMDYEEWCMAWKMLKSVYENASGADVAQVSISFIVSVCFLVGGVSKLGQLTKGLKVPAYLMPAVETVTVGSRAIHHSESLQVLPLGVLGGLTLKYAQY